MKAPVNHIIDASFVDGPGNRTVIFFQGCNFHCAYCHNPETIRPCIHCGICVPFCRQGALSKEDGKVIWDDSRCIDCGACYRNCPYFSTPRVKEMTPQQVMERVERNIPFIRGITVSGGECSLQRDFLVELFRLARDRGLSTLLDTNGGLPIAWDEGLMEVTDGVMLDIKGTDPEFHRNLVGHGNETVLQNAVELARAGKLVEVRTVVLADEPGSRQTVRDTVELLAPHLEGSTVTYRLIRFRPVGVRGEASDWKVPDLKQMEELKRLAEGKGFSRVIIT